MDSQIQGIVVVLNNFGLIPMAIDKPEFPDQASYFFHEWQSKTKLTGVDAR